MNDLIPIARLTGTVALDGLDIYTIRIDVVEPKKGGLSATQPVRAGHRVFRQSRDTRTEDFISGRFR